MRSIETQDLLATFALPEFYFGLALIAGPRTRGDPTAILVDRQDFRLGCHLAEKFCRFSIQDRNRIAGDRQHATFLAESDFVDRFGRVFEFQNEFGVGLIPKTNTEKSSAAFLLLFVAGHGL